MRICVTRSSRFSYSETFIRDQIAGLSKLAEVYPIHSGRLPERGDDGKLLSSRVFWLLHKIVKTVTGQRNNYFGNHGIKKFLLEHRIDVVIANYGLSGAHLAPICRDLNIPLVVIFHGHDATDKKLLAQYRTKYPQLFRDAAQIIAVSSEMKQRLIKLGADDKKVEVIPCGVDPEKFTPSSKPKEKTFLFVGRMVPKKGPLYTIRAFHKVLQKEPDARLLIVGSKGGMYRECADLVKTLGIEGSVSFTGILPQEKIAELMQQATAYVQHSVTAPNGDMEGTPVSILEAAAAGLPIVSTQHGGIKDAVIHGKTGYLVEERDEESMASFMLKLLQDQSTAVSMGEEGRRHIQTNYRQDRQIRKIFDCALKAIEQSHLHHPEKLVQRSL